MATRLMTPAGAARRERLLSEFERWGYDTRGWSRETRRKYVGLARALEVWLQQKRSKSVLWANAKDLKAWLFDQPPDPRTRNGYRGAIIALFDFLVDVEYVEINHALALPRLPEPYNHPKALVGEDAQKVDRVIPLFDLKTQVLIGVFLYAGLRKSEAAALEWPRIDVADRLMHVRGKGAKDRTIPMGEDLWSLLGRWREQCEDPRWVFPSTHPTKLGHHVSVSWIDHRIDAVEEESGVKGLHPHQLRHTFATRLVELGVHIKIVQELLGHASISTTERYLKVVPVHLRGAIDRLNYNGEPVGTKVCPECERETEPRWRICPFCGERLKGGR